MAFEILNEADSVVYTPGPPPFNRYPQAEPDKVDFDILAQGVNGEGVVSGAAVTPQGVPDTTVAVAAAVVRIAGTDVAYAGGNVDCGAAAAAFPRFDLIAIDNAGVASAVNGVAALVPVFPAVPANSVIVAAVWRAANDNTITAADIVDKRCLLLGATFGTAPTLLGIVGGIATPTRFHHTLSAQAGAADDLDGMTFSSIISNGEPLIIRPDAGDTITVKHNALGGADARNILCIGNADIVLDDDHDFAICIYATAIGAGSWMVLGGGGGGGAPHNLLDGVTHPDTVAQAVSVGSLVYGDNTPDWNELVAVIPGGPALRNVLGLDQGDTVPAWKAMFDAVNPAPVGVAAPGTSLIASHRDHVHAGGGLALANKGELHGYAAADAIVAAAGADNMVLQSDAADAEGLTWRAIPFLAGIAEVGGATVLQTSAASPHVEIDDDLRVERIGVKVNPSAAPSKDIFLQNISQSAATLFIIHNNPAITAIANNVQLRSFDIDSGLTVNGGVSSPHTGLSTLGAFMTATALGAGGGTGTFTEVDAVTANPGAVVSAASTLNITRMTAFRAAVPESILEISGTINITDLFGLWVTGGNLATITTITRHRQIYVEEITNISGDTYGIQIDNFGGSAGGLSFPFFYGDLGNLEFAINDEGTIEMEEEAAEPAAPGAGNWKLYPKSDGWYGLEDDGTEKKLSTVISHWGGGGLIFASSLTRYWAPFFGYAAYLGVVEAQTEWVTPRGGTMKNFYVRAGTNTLNENIPFTVRVNGVDTAITLIVTAATPGTYSDLANAVDVVAGDIITVKSVESAATLGLLYFGWSLELEETNG